ncbi:hypothetical protein [Rhodoblastus sp.]|jgi:hypothetical protein|uniref:hypothetical protein n=1 Tax=Rhodoblastus sp. TaxID=1962975 RepID=UPI0025D58F8A|nr:hypothetical protein [Rhodoblastus sp.]
MDMEGSPENRPPQKKRRRIKAKLSDFFVPVNAAHSQNAVKTRVWKTCESLPLIAKRG